MIFYTDGSANTKNRYGGFGVVGVNESFDALEFIVHKESLEPTTNNREELKAILWVLENYGNTLKNDFFIPVVYSDSNYSVQTYNEWMENWAQNGWIKSDKKTPENLDLIKRMYDLKHSGYMIDLHHIKGHAGHKWNELADRLAKGEVTSLNGYKD